MSNIKSLEQSIPVGPLKLAVLNSIKPLGKRVDETIVGFKKEIASTPNNHLTENDIQDSYIIDCSCPRFGSGEAKGLIGESIRGADLFILADVCNHSITYKMNGHINHMSPDDHYQDIKRIIAAATGKARRINVIMPFLYESRQHKRTKRESLDCAYALEELVGMGVDNIITFDAHDPRVQNAIPLNGFDNFTPPYQFAKALLKANPELIVDKDHLIVISPDEGAMSRAVYFSSVLGVNMGTFYKRRDYSVIENGKNPIVAHEYLGDDLNGKAAVVIDDMISSGESMLEVARKLKERGASKVYVCTTFGLFTDGFAKFDEAYAAGYFDSVITTNLTYLPEEVYEKPYFQIADMTKFLSMIITSLNHDMTIGTVLSPTERISTLLKKHNEKLNSK